MMTIEQVSLERRLRICVLGDIDGIHTHAWTRYFVQRGHEVHAVSFYPPSRPPEGVQVHSLRAEAQPGAGAAGRAAQRVPPAAQRMIHLLRYRRAGLRRTVESIAPDVFHAHYLVEHGFYGTAAAYRPYLVSAWGSDVLQEATRSPASRAIARFVLGRVDMATANNRHMARQMVLKLGIERSGVQHIVLGTERFFLERPEASVNARSPESGHPPTVISTRSLDSPLYNVDVVLRAMARVRQRLPAARLVVAGDGRFRPRYERLAAELGIVDAVSFSGFLGRDAFRDALADAEVFVSVPSSDATSVALLQAMGVGCFPIVSDLASQQELVAHGDQGFRVSARNDEALAGAILRALEDRELRQGAVERNRGFVEEYGVLEDNMARMEAWYYRLAGRTDDLQPVAPAATPRAPGG